MEITKGEVASAQKALADLEAAFSQGRILRGQYLGRRNLLLANLERTVSANTEIERNPQAFFNRDVLNLSARPAGYETRDITDRFTSRAQPHLVARSLIEMSKHDYTANIMDSLRDNARFENTKHSYTDAMDHGSFGGINQATYPDIWTEISTQPGVIAALERLAKAVKSRVEGAMRQGMPPDSAQTYIINNARSAGASLTEQGYDRRRASEIVQRVISGEITLIAASNLVTGDLNEASKAILASNPDYVLNPRPTSANSTSLARMSLKDIIETREAALATLDDPMSYDEERQWAAEFIQEANIAIAQREKQMDVVTGSSANQVLVSSDPSDYSLLTKNDGLPSTLNQTRRAFAAGVPNLELVLGDLFTVDGVTYFDHTTNTPTVVAHSPKATPILEDILRGLNYALGSPYWDDQQRARLTDLRRILTAHMATIGPYKPPFSKPEPGNNANNNNNNNNSTVIDDPPQYRGPAHQHHDIPAAHGRYSGDSYGTHRYDQHTPVEAGQTPAVPLAHRINFSTTWPAGTTPDWTQEPWFIDRMGHWVEGQATTRKKERVDNPFQWNVYDNEDKKVKVKVNVKGKQKLVGLGASTSTTSSSRTSGAYRFDPRSDFRWE
jgi:hypothetical protein